MRVDLLNQSPENVKVDAVSLAASDGKAWQIATKGDATESAGSPRSGQVRFSVTAPADAALTRPYFTRPDDEQPYLRPRRRALSQSLAARRTRSR